jgi:ferredoxin
MPWIDERKCVGCGICLDVCSPGAIQMCEKLAVIDDSLCIRCGKCHDVCPAEAVRHDGERLPMMLRDNRDYVFRLLRYCDGEVEREQLLERLIRHFRLQQKTAQITIDWIMAERKVLAEAVQ